MRKVIIGVTALLLASTAVAQQDRSNMWEFGVLLNNLSSVKLDGSNGSSISVDDSTGFGFSALYNVNNNFAFGGEFTWNTPDYRAVLIPDNPLDDPETINHELDVFGVNLKAVWNIIDGPITPYVEAGLGWADIDSNISDQPPITGCWWDPWWGYVCDTFYSTYGKTQESYNAAVGIRWDMDNGMTLKGSYGILEIDTSNATEDISLDAIRAELSWRF